MLGIYPYSINTLNKIERIIMRFKILNKYKEEVTSKNTKSMAEKAARCCG